MNYFTRLTSLINALCDITDKSVQSEFKFANGLNLVSAAVRNKFLLRVQESKRILRKFLELYLGPVHSHIHTGKYTFKTVHKTPAPCHTFHCCVEIRGLIGLKSLCCDRLQGQEVTQ